MIFDRVRKVVLIAVALMLVNVVAPSNASANAGIWDYYSGCYQEATNYTQFASTPYWYSYQTQVPPNASCNDINSVAHGCAYHRVRFYPSSGGSFVSTYKWDCDGPKVIASSVADSTRYRSETQTSFHNLHIEH